MRETDRGEEVVRCVDCDVPHNRWTGCPNLNGLIPPPDFYCARGRRKQQPTDSAGSVGTVGTPINMERGDD